MMGRFNQVALDAMPGESQAIARLKHVIDTISPLNTTVLIYGEPGTEKETVARMIHEKNPAARGEFVAVQLSAIPEALLRDALFGHGTGMSRRARPGYFELATSGTLFLEDIGDMDPITQTSLLRILQDGQYKRAGGAVMSAQARIVAATSKNLKKLVQNGDFRQDLFYRLNFVTLEIPPLRERLEDIPMLARHFAQRASMRCDIRGAYLKPEVIALLKSYHWPGNLRQLENCVQMLIAHSAPHLPHGNAPLSDRITSAPERIDGDQFLPFAKVKALFEHEGFQHALRGIQDQVTASCRDRVAGQNPHPWSGANDLYHFLQQKYNAPETETDIYN